MKLKEFILVVSSDIKYTCGSWKSGSCFKSYRLPSYETLCWP